MVGLATPPNAIPEKPVKPTAAPGTPYVLAPHYMDRIKKFEGFTARPKWDAKQYSWGYGTRAPGPTGSITPEQADADFGREIGEAHGIVHSFAPNAPEHVKAALTSLTYNSGGGWTKGAIGQAIARGDYAGAAGLMPHYKVTSAGKFLPGLATRRAEEASWMTGAPTSPVTAPTATPASGAAPMALGMTQPPSQDQVNLFAKRGMAMMPDWNRPIGHWTQALGNLAQQISGAMWLDKANQGYQQQADATNKAWDGYAGGLMPGMSKPPSNGAATAAATGFGPTAAAPKTPPIANPDLAPKAPKQQVDDTRPAIAQATSGMVDPPESNTLSGLSAMAANLVPQPKPTLADSNAPVTTSVAPGLTAKPDEVRAPEPKPGLTAPPPDTQPAMQGSGLAERIQAEKMSLVPLLRNRETREFALSRLNHLQQMEMEAPLKQAQLENAQAMARYHNMLAAAGRIIQPRSGASLYDATTGRWITPPGFDDASAPAESLGLDRDGNLMELPPPHKTGAPPDTSGQPLLMEAALRGGEGQNVLAGGTDTLGTRSGLSFKGDYGPSGTLTTEVPGLVVTPRGQSDKFGTRQLEGIRAIDELPDDQRQRLRDSMALQRRWESIRGKAPSGYIYNTDGTLKSLKEDEKEQRSLDKMQPLLDDVKNAKTVLTDSNVLQRGAAHMTGGWVYPSKEEAMRSVEHAVSQMTALVEGKRHANAQDVRMLKFFAPTWTDSAEMVGFKLDQLHRIFSNYLGGGSRQGEIFRSELMKAVEAARKRGGTALPQSNPSSPSNPIDDARKAIQRGADRGAVIQRLQQMGYDATGL